ncbi:MAG: extracellular solute-binding protein [Anaerolineae bacterium]
MLTRREFTKLLAAATGAGALAACTPQSPATPAPKEAEVQPTVAVAEQEPTTASAPAGQIEYYTYDLGVANESREAAQEAFQSANSGAEVKLTVLPYGESWDKLAALMAAGSPPDVIYSDFSLLRHALEGQLLDLAELFNADPVLSKPELFTMDMQDDLLAKFGTSHIYNLILGTWVPVLYYNTEIFDAAGEPYPNEEWTWDDLRQVAKRLTVPETPQWGVQFGTTFDMVGWLWWQHQPEEFWAVPQIFPEKTAFNNEVGVGTFSLWHNLGWVDKSGVPFSEVGSYDVYGGAFGAGKVAMAIGGDWDAGWGYRDLAFKWDMTMLPVVKKGYRPALNCMVASNVIAAETKNKDLAWQFARFMTATKEGQSIVGAGAYETPVLKEAAHSDAVLQPDWAVAGYGVRVRSAELPGRMYCPYQLSLNLWEFPSKHIDPTVEQLTLGETTPEEAVAYLDEQGTPYFQQQKAEM